MKIFILTLIVCTFSACSSIKEKQTSEVDSKKTTNNSHSLKIQTKDLLKKLFKIWNLKNTNLIESELGAADEQQTGSVLITYSYLSKFKTPYKQLILKMTKNGEIKFIDYEFLDEKNEELNDKWILGLFKNDKWKIIEIPNKSHIVVTKT